MKIMFELSQDEVGVIVAEHIRGEHNLLKETITVEWEVPPQNCKVTIDEPKRVKTSVFTHPDEGEL